MVTLLHIFIETHHLLTPWMIMQTFRTFRPSAAAAAAGAEEQMGLSCHNG